MICINWCFQKSIKNDKELQNILNDNSQAQKAETNSEEKTDSEFHYCRVLIVDYEFMVSAVFDNRGYIVDLENMRLVE